MTTASPRQAQGCSRPDRPSLVEEYILPQESVPALQITNVEMSFPPEAIILPRGRGGLGHGQIGGEMAWVMDRQGRGGLGHRQTGEGWPGLWTDRHSLWTIILHAPVASKVLH